MQSNNQTYVCDMYHKTPKNSDTQKFDVITLKVEHGGFTLE